MGYYNDDGIVAPLDRFGANNDDWNHDADGYPGIGLIANAISTWSALQERTTVTVGEAALTFFIKPELVVQAIEFHYWMCWDKQDGPIETWVIGHDGE